MSRNVLVIQWMNGALSAAQVAGRKVLTEWTSSAPVETVDDFALALPAAVVGTQFHGREAVMVIEDRKLVYHLQEAPAGRQKTIRRFIERQVLKSRFFEDQEPVWGIHQAIPVKTGQRFLLTVFPREWVVTIRDAFAGEGLRLAGVFSAATVLARCLPRLSNDASSPSLITSDAAGILSLTAARGNGHLMFARSVALVAVAPVAEASPAGLQLRVAKAATRAADRLEQELNRTRLFCQQQFETQLRTLWVLGEEARKTFADVKLPDGMRMETAPPDQAAHLFLIEAAAMTARSPGSLLAQITGGDVHQRRVLALSVAACLLFALGFWGYVNHLARQRDAELQSLQARAEEVKLRNDENIRLWHETLEKKALVASVGNPDDPAIASLFCRYLGASLPDRFVVSRMELTQASNRWMVRLEGRQRDPADEHLRGLADLEKQFLGGPFKMVTVSSSRTALLQEGGAEIRRVPNVLAEATDEKVFFIDGYIP
ncbi:MAG: hypothetical protein HY299_23050 [Verrucomicrobia bacterium]|nr:hypothetical protein [Verrucomicrobiota bacterium]